jgi:hypothetical protein
MNFMSEENENADRDHQEYLEHLRSEKPLPDSGIKRLAKQIDKHNAKVMELIYRIEASGHPKAAEIAKELIEDCVALNSAEDTVAGHLPKKAK